MSVDYKRLTHCRVCQSTHVHDVLDLGQQALANALKATADEQEARFPLTLCACSDCGLVQIRETIPPERLFSQYVWVTQTSSTARRFAYDFASALQTRANLKPSDFVIEIASNDGTYLRPFLEQGFTHVLGVDPAENIIAMAKADGVPSKHAFWDLDTAAEIRAEHGPARAIFARNVIPHIAHLHHAVQAISETLADDGVGAIEFHSALEILNGLQYDSIYHEHLCYFSLHSLTHLLQQYKLHVFDILQSPISGGALIVYFARTAHSPSDAVKDLQRQEAQAEVNNWQRWEQFGKDCLAHRQMTQEIFHQYQDRKLIGFGASARSSTYLNFCDLSDLSLIIDNSPLKQGRYTAGTSIPVVSYTVGMEQDPQWILLLAWNFQQEIIQDCRQQGYRGGFIVPFPNQISLIAAQEGI